MHAELKKWPLLSRHWAIYLMSSQTGTFAILARLCYGNFKRSQVTTLSLAPSFPPS